MGCGNHIHVFGGNIQSNRGGGGKTHQEGGGFQIPLAAVVPVIRRLSRSSAQHQKGKSGVGAAW